MILGMVNHLEQYIPKSSEIYYPLRNTLKKSIGWYWPHESSKALKEIQTTLTTELALSFFDTKCLIEIQVDTTVMVEVSV